MFKSLKGSISNFINNLNLCGQNTRGPLAPQKFQIGSRIIQEETLISEGGYGYIWKAHDIKTKEKFASPESLELAEKELKILKNLPFHENIVKFYDGKIITFEDMQTKMAILIFELCPDGSLFDYITKRKDQKLEEFTILNIISEIIKALVHLHSQNPPVTHRDLKLENVLLKDNKFKICDFGSCSFDQTDFSKIHKNEFYHYEEIYEKNTTLMYRPPEMIELYLRYPVNEKVDMWMLGCILYILCFYKHPFQDASKLSIVNSGFYIPENNYSPDLINLIKILLIPNPMRRPSSKEIDVMLNQYKIHKKLTINEELLKFIDSSDFSAIKTNNFNDNSNTTQKKHCSEKNNNKNEARTRNKSISNKTSIKQPLVDFTNEWGDFVQADNVDNNKQKMKDNLQEIDFKFDSFPTENKPPLINQWGATGSFMNAFKINMPMSPKMDDCEEKKIVFNVPYLKMQTFNGIDSKKPKEESKK